MQTNLNNFFLKSSMAGIRVQEIFVHQILIYRGWLGFFCAKSVCFMLRVTLLLLSSLLLNVLQIHYIFKLLTYLVYRRDYDLYGNDETALSC